jgi:hypothetical protein
VGNIDSISNDRQTATRPGRRYFNKTALGFLMLAMRFLSFFSILMQPATSNPWILLAQQSQHAMQLNEEPVVSMILSMETTDDSEGESEY